MKIYFLSSRPCALTLNDVYFGITDNFERFADIPLTDRVFVRFSPQGGMPITFFLTEALRFSPPEGCEVYLLKDGLAIYARDFPPLTSPLRVITQQLFDNVLATVFAQGSIHLSIQTENDFFIAYLPPSFEKCSLSFHANLLFIETKNELTVYALNGEQLLHERIIRYTVQENTLNATMPLSDSLNRTATAQWSLSKNSCVRTHYAVNEPAAEKPSDDLLPYAFFENVLIGANFDELLSDELIPEKEKLRAFLGDFEAVIPTADPNVCGLIKKKATRLYEVSYYTVKTEKGKILDVFV